jgi:hypothetical protein
MTAMILEFWSNSSHKSKIIAEWPWPGRLPFVG